jgi:hypothetical protein
MAAAENIEHKSTRRATPRWIVVTSQELSALWRGGKIPALFVPFSIVLSFMSYLLATNKVLSLTPPRRWFFHRADHSRGRSSYQSDHWRQCD